MDNVTMSLRKKPSKKSSRQERPNAAPAAAVVNTTPPAGGGAGLPEGVRGRLWEMFGQIEREFELMYAENAVLREKVEAMNDKVELLMSERAEPSPQSHLTSSLLTPTVGGTAHNSHLTMSDSHPVTSSTPLRKIKASGANLSKILKPTKKSSSGVKPMSLECSLVSSYSGHRDGVWQVARARNGLPVIGSASADGTACVWDVNTNTLLLKYMGHSGSVNSIAFHPTERLACTGSGDCTAHIWKCAVSPAERMSTRHDSSGEDRYISDDDITLDSTDSHNVTVKTPVTALGQHTAPVVSCDWMCDGQRLVTASWDHTARLWDVEKATVIHTLAGHDQELTHVCTHPKQHLVVTSSHDATFRLWDFRSPPIHSVNVFQGHSKVVSSAVFSTSDNVISASDDHTVKIWDLRNMRSPVASIRVDCGINRISVSHDRHVLAVPLDNRHIRLYDLAGNRVAHLPHRNRMGHVRMVHSVAWSHDHSHDKCNLFSAGFDNRVLGWRVTFT